MKAIVQNGYGSPDVLELKEVVRPAVKDKHVLVRVHAAGINAGSRTTTDTGSLRTALPSG